MEVKRDCWAGRGEERQRKWGGRREWWSLTAAEDVYLALCASHVDSITNVKGRLTVTDGEIAMERK